MTIRVGVWALLGCLLTSWSWAAELPTQPTQADVAYGPHARNVLDFWKAPGDGPRPLLVYIHGGGWTSGDKKQDLKNFQPFLEKGISYAAINYRLTPDNPLPAPVHDAARAIQFIRTKAAEWNIDTQHIALTGGSAGACSSMWLLLHNDLADPKAEDPVLRQSTRVCAAAVSAGQTSIDPKVIEGWLGPNVLQHRMINMAVGEKTIDGALAGYEKYRPLYLEFSAYNHVDAKDPPLLMTYPNDMTLPSKNAGHGIHHPVYGTKLKEKSDSLGHECHLLIPGVSKSDKYASANDFLFAKLLGTEPKPTASTSALNVPPAGFVALFNGKDLSGWRGGNTVNPADRLKLEPAARAAQDKASVEDIQKHWSVKDGLLINDGQGLYLTTDKDYGDFEFMVDFKLSPKADSGVYLRGVPQVQIWDFTEAGGHWKLGADKGSGGLWNNPADAPGKNPTVLADKPIGEWNTFHITIIGDDVTVVLNGQKVVDKARLHNYFAKGQSLLPAGPIQLQTHGGEIQWRNIFIKELPKAASTK